MRDMSVRDNITFLFIQMVTCGDSKWILGVGAANKPSEDDRSSPQQPNFNGEQLATSKGTLTKPVAGWMVIGPFRRDQFHLQEQPLS